MVSIGTVVTNPPVMKRIEPLGVLHAGSAQLASWPVKLDDPPVVTSAGEKNMEKPGSPVWLGEVDVTNRAPVLSAVIPPDTLLYVTPLRLLLMLTLLYVLVPASKVKDPLAVPPSPNLTPARNHFRGAETPSAALTDPAVMERVVPEGSVHPESKQSASWPVKVDVPAVPGSIGEKSSDKPGSPAWDPTGVETIRSPPLSGAKAPDTEL